MNIKSISKELAEKYPVIKAQLPLKINIKTDIAILYPELSKQKLFSLMAFICRHPDYLKHVIEGKNRYDLEGLECGVISDSEREYSMKVLEQHGKQTPAKPKQKPAEPEQVKPRPVLKTKLPIITLKKKRHFVKPCLKK